MGRPDRVLCDSHDPDPELARQRVMAGLVLPSGAELLRCEALAPGSVEYADGAQCAIRLPAGSFEVLFPEHRYQPAYQPSDSRQHMPAAKLASELGVTLVGSIVDGAGLFVSFTQAHDVVIVQHFEHDRCSDLSEII
jgi:hypothetical protein